MKKYVRGGTMPKTTQTSYIGVGTLVCSQGRDDGRKQHTHPHASLHLFNYLYSLQGSYMYMNLKVQCQLYTYTTTSLNVLTGMVDAP